MNDLLCLFSSLLLEMYKAGEDKDLLLHLLRRESKALRVLALQVRTTAGIFFCQ